MRKIKKKKNIEYPLSFKKDIIQLYESGISKSSLAREYDITETLIDDWVEEYSEELLEDTELSDIERELKYLRKKHKELKMENDLLKQIKKVHDKMKN